MTTIKLNNLGGLNRVRNRAGLLGTRHFVFAAEHHERWALHRLGPSRAGLIGITGIQIGKIHPVGGTLKQPSATKIQRHARTFVPTHQPRTTVTPGVGHHHRGAIIVFRCIQQDITHRHGR